MLPDAVLCELAALREVERHRRVVQLALRRSVVAARLGCPLEEVAVWASSGSPIVSPSSDFILSASHHDDMTVLAVGQGTRALGVDIEPVYEPGWDDALVEVLSASELKALSALPESERSGAYFACWTLKEAVMKALGEGLSERDPKSVEVSVPPSPARLVALDGRPVPADWSLATLALDGRVCSVAVRGGVAGDTQTRRWPVDLPPTIG
jgi:4'-phosphopantetheinyl transferase